MIESQNFYDNQLNNYLFPMKKNTKKKELAPNQSVFVKINCYSEKKINSSSICYYTKRNIFS